VGTAQPGQPHPRRNGRVVSRTSPAVRRSRRALHFKGQLPDEQVIWIRHQHPLFLLTPAWPVLIGIVALAAAYQWVGALPLVMVLAGAFTLVMLGRWFVVDLPGWYARKYILTDRRAIMMEHFYTPDRREAVLTNVLQITVDRPSPWLVALNIGDVHVGVVGASVDMTGVHRPRRLADSILLTQQEARRARAAQATSKAAQSPDLLSKLEERLDTIQEPTEPDDIPPPTPPPFRGFLARNIPINLMPDEAVIDVIYRHWFVLIKRLVLPVGVGMVIVSSGLLTSFLGLLIPVNIGSPLVIIGAIIGLGWSLFVYLNYIDDVFVLTTHRLIDIDRVVFLLSEYSNDAPYNRVQDIHVEVGFIGKILGFGTIVVETAGREHSLDMVGIPHPSLLMDRIFALIGKAKEREQRTESQRQRREQLKLLASAFGALIVTVPDVRGQTVLQAIARAQAANLRLVVERERPVAQGPLGVVLEQMPLPESAALPDSELRIVVSAHAGQPTRARTP
jgi:membrane protein YdbS with pleckstrin-like domain